MSDAAFDSMMNEMDNFSLEQCKKLFARLSEVFTKKKNESVSPRKSMFGVWKDEAFYMAPDFDEPLEEFAEYM